jgi:hypothetical protein
MQKNLKQCQYRRCCAVRPRPTSQQHFAPLATRNAPTQTQKQNKKKKEKKKKKKKKNGEKNETFVCFRPTCKSSNPLLNKILKKKAAIFFFFFFHPVLFGDSEGSVICKLVRLAFVVQLFAWGPFFFFFFFFFLRRSFCPSPLFVLCCPGEPISSLECSCLCCVR